MKIEILNDGKAFPLTRNELVPGTFAECDNGTVVFVGKGLTCYGNPLNIENGVGGYSEYARFRTLRPTKIAFTL